MNSLTHHLPDCTLRLPCGDAFPADAGETGALATGGGAGDGDDGAAAVGVDGVPCG